MYENDQKFIFVSSIDKWHLIVITVVEGNNWWLTRTELVTLEGMVAGDRRAVATRYKSLEVTRGRHLGSGNTAADDGI